MSLDRFASAATLYRRTSEGSLAFLGTCFAFRKRHVFLTAAHCTKGLDAADLVVVSAFAGRLSEVQRVTRHPHADLAALEVDAAGMSPIRPYTTLGVSAQYGAEVCAIGFPEDSTAAGTTEPTGRLFRAHIQRFLVKESHLGYRYHAAELSIGAPAGLSGGPVFLADMSGNLVGLVTENFESTTYLRTIQELHEPGNVFKEHIHTVINYAVCVWLPPLERWLGEIVGSEF